MEEKDEALIIWYPMYFGSGAPLCHSKFYQLHATSAGYSISESYGLVSIHSH